MSEQRTPRSEAITAPRRRTPGARDRAVGAGLASAAAAAALLVAACAAPSQQPGSGRAAGSDCFFASTMRDWRPLDDRNLILFANGRRPYHVELVRPAMGLSFGIMLGVYDRDGRICPFGGDAIVVDGAIPDRIPIRSITRLSPEELEAVYIEYGISPPVVIDAEEVEPEEEAD